MFDVYTFSVSNGGVRDGGCECGLRRGPEEQTVTGPTLAVGGRVRPVFKHAITITYVLLFS